jgi:hypothetical protein
VAGKKKFSKISCIVNLYGKNNRALTFENFSPLVVFAGAQKKVGRQYQTEGISDMSHDSCMPEHLSL